MNQIGIFNETDEKIEELEMLHDLLEYAAKIEKVEDALFNVIIIDNEKIRQINKDYRGIDRETDVISFALEDDTKCVQFENEPRVLGDIYISLEKARKQAISYGHSFKREICFLALHGFLHLLGYDHMKKEEEKIMFERQELILDGFGIKR